MSSSQRPLNSNPNNDNASAFSLEFVWKGKASYWAGKVRVVDILINDQTRYTVEIPQRDDLPNQEVSLAFKNVSTSSSKPVNFLLFKNLQTAATLSLKAGIFNEKEEKVMTKHPDGSFSRNTFFTREDVSIKLDVLSLQPGKHYKMLVNHQMEREPSSPFWSGQNLQATLIEAGLCKQTPQKASAPQMAESKSSIPITSSSSTSSSQTVIPEQQKNQLLTAFENILTGLLLVKIQELKIRSMPTSGSPDLLFSAMIPDTSHTPTIQAAYLEMLAAMDKPLIDKLYASICAKDSRQFLIDFLDADGATKLKDLAQTVLSKAKPDAAPLLIREMAANIVQKVMCKKGLTEQQSLEQSLRQSRLM